MCVGPRQFLYTGLRHKTGVRTSEAECVRSLTEAASILGTSPTKASYEELGLTPAAGTIIRVMGSWNAAKQAAGLNTNPSSGSRVATKPADVTLPSDVSWEELTSDQRWHYRNVEWNTKRTLKRRSRLRSWVNERKRVRGCTRCKISDPACLDYHHTDVGEKEMAIGKMITFGYGKATLRSEMEKCTVICANCHRKEHLDPPFGSDTDSVKGARDTVNSTGSGQPAHRFDERDSIRAWAYKQKRTAGGCARCDEDDPLCLDFHHTSEDKKTTVSNMISNTKPKDEIAAEIAKCTVLCANCHRRVHHVDPTS